MRAALGRAFTAFRKDGERTSRARIAAPKTRRFLRILRISWTWRLHAQTAATAASGSVALPGYLLFGLCSGEVVDETGLDQTTGRAN